MSQADDRDAYVAVEVPLPNGIIARGKPIPWKAAQDLILLSDAFAAGGRPSATLVPLLEGFAAATGITEAYLLDRCPDLTMGELVDLINRFFYSRRPARTGGPTSPAVPAGNGGA